MNLLYIVCDSIRADYVGCYGNTDINTSVLDWMAENGVRFDQVISTSAWTLPSISTLISGVYSHKLGMFDWAQSFDSATKTLFHYFKEHNYKVGSFVFDDKYLFSNMDFTNLQGHSRNLTPILNWIEKNSSDEFFLFIHNWWTHIPYEPKSSAESWRTSVRELHAMLREGMEGMEYCKKLYTKAIEDTSENKIAKIIKALKEQEILDNTIVIFTADHGEAWGERLKDRSEIINNFALHGRYLYDESLKVPLIFYCPKILPSNKAVKSQVRNVDIVPTILDLFDFQDNNREQGYRDFDGRSLKKLIFGSEENDRIAISSTTDTVDEKIILHSLARMSVRAPPWKFIWTVEKNQEKLYNLETDPHETINVVTQFPQVAKKLKNLLEEELKNVPSENIPIKEERRIKNKIKELKKLKKI